MKKYGLPIGIAVLMLIFILMPFFHSGLTIRLYMDGFEGEGILMYYATDDNPLMGNDRICVGEIDKKNNVVAFRFTPKLADHINGLRLDFPDAEQALTIRGVSVSSGGVIQKSYDPCGFFSEENIAAKNGILTIDLVKSENMVCVVTEETDPFVLFGDGLLSDILGQRSSYRLTRILFCALVAAGYVLYRLRPFGGEEDVC